MQQQLISLVSDLKTMRVQMSTASGISPLAFECRFKCIGTFVGHGGPIWSLAVSGDYLLSCSSDATFRVWDCRNMKSVRTLKGRHGIIYALCLSGGMLYTASDDGAVQAWSLETFEEVGLLSVEENCMCTLAVAKDQLFGGSYKCIVVWDRRSHKRLAKLTDMNHWVRALAVADQVLYAGSYKVIHVRRRAPSGRRRDRNNHGARCAQIIDIERNAIVGQLQAPGRSVYSLAVTQKYLIAGTYENVCEIWTLGTHQHVTTLRGHAGAVYALVVARFAEHDLLFSASYDTTIHVWTLSNFQLTQTLLRHAGSVNALACNGKQLFSAGVDHSIKVWQ